MSGFLFSMAMARVKLSIEVRFAWWWPLYLNTVTAFAKLTGLEPDADKFAFWAKKAMKTRVVTR